MTFDKWWNAHKPVDVSDDLPALLIAKSWAREAWDDRQDEIDTLKQEIDLLLQACSVCLLRDMKAHDSGSVRSKLSQRSRKKKI